MMTGGGGAVSVSTLSDGKTAPKKPVKRSVAAAGNKDTFATVIALTRQINGKEQRIIISGDADLLSNSELGRNSPEVINFNFSTALFNWLDYGQYPVDTSRPDAKDKRVTISTDYVALLKIVYIYGIPGAILIFAVIFLIRRKRK